MILKSLGCDVTNNFKLKCKLRPLSCFMSSFYTLQSHTKIGHNDLMDFICWYQILSFFLWCPHWRIFSVSTDWLGHWKLSVSLSSNIMMLPITITSVSNISTYINTNIIVLLSDLQLLNNNVHLDPPNCWYSMYLSCSISQLKFEDVDEQKSS